MCKCERKSNNEYFLLYIAVYNIYLYVRPPYCQETGHLMSQNIFYVSHKSNFIYVDAVFIAISCYRAIVKVKDKKYNRWM